MLLQYTGIQGVHTSEFLAYCSAAVKEILELTGEAMADVKAVADKATPEASKEVQELLDTAHYLTRFYMKPFIEVIKPILGP